MGKKTDKPVSGPFRPTTEANVSQDLRALAAFLETRDPDPDAQRAYEELRTEAATTLNKMLNSWVAEDVFGTEGQLDPRGDHRDSRYYHA